MQVQLAKQGGPNTPEANKQSKKAPGGRGTEREGKGGGTNAQHRPQARQGETNEEKEQGQREGDNKPSNNKKGG